MRPGTTRATLARQVAGLLVVLAGLLTLPATGAAAAERLGAGCRTTSAPTVQRLGSTRAQAVAGLVCPAAVRARLRVLTQGAAGPAPLEQGVRPSRPTELRGTPFLLRPGASYRVVVELSGLRGRALPALSGAPVVVAAGPTVPQVLPADRAARLALAEVGRRSGSRYGAPAGAPWCAYFASWVVRHVAPSMPVLPSVASWRAWGRAHHRWSSTPEVGDVVVYGSSHVGVVVRVRGDGAIDTVEGNFSHKVSHNRVRVGRATASHEPAPISGFVRPY